MLYTGFENLSALFDIPAGLRGFLRLHGHRDRCGDAAVFTPKNFTPYKARNAAEFWKRWHISLSRWLQDYLYIPLGGNRNGTFSYAILLGIAFLASALAKSWWVFGGVLVLTLVIGAIILFRRCGAGKSSDINRMDTMLLADSGTEPVGTL